VFDPRDRDSELIGSETGWTVWADAGCARRERYSGRDECWAELTPSKVDVDE
jgi:hypothetical protein